MHCICREENDREIVIQDCEGKTMCKNLGNDSFRDNSSQFFQIFVGEFPQSVVSVDFIVGSDSNPLRNTKEGFCDRRIQKQILNR